MNKRIVNEYNNYKKHIIKSSNDSVNKYVSPILLNAQDILELYGINNIDDLEIWIKKNLDIINFFTVNRVLNSWIRVKILFLIIIF